MTGGERLAVLGADGAWIVVDAGDVRSVYRTATTPGAALDLDRGEPLAPAK